MNYARIVIFSLITTALLFPFKADALIPPLLQFDGYPVTVIPCTCSPGNFANFFTPLYLSSIPVAGTMGVTPATFRFPYYLAGIPGTPHVGAYLPAIPACWQIVPSTPPFCIPFPTLGVMGFSGTGVTGAK